ncbi:LYR motif-containing protein 1-like [Oncorhynchus keta]|uniref:LYR motif-containing protein 1-like n=1 Tax=Oncorhynchus keta TaxID=8018 RepID=UPI00227B13FD|nr:LYR motif-containing protein 1-like [Oncorhynchus keta]
MRHVVKKLTAQQLTDQESIKKCLAECETRIEMAGLYYRNPYPRLIYLLIMGMATQKGRKLKAQQRMRKQASQFTYRHMRTADTTAYTR